MSNSEPQVGDKIKTFFSDREDGLSTIIKVMPYDGRFPDMFNRVLRVTAPSTDKGWADIPYHTKNTIYCVVKQQRTQKE